MKEKKDDYHTEVLNYLSRHHFNMRRCDLIEELKNSHPNETGYSDASINRRLEKMCKENLITIVTDDKILKLYGIKKEAGNASYLFAGRVNEISKHFNSIFDSLEKKDKKKEIDPDLIKELLLEIKIYENDFICIPSQLGIFVACLEIEDAELIDKLLYVFYNHMDKGILPEKKDDFLEILKKLLEKYPDGHKEYKNLRCYIIQLLGHHENYAVIEQIKKDAKAGRLSNHSSEYCHNHTAMVIEKFRTELFFLGIELRKEGNTIEAEALAYIRNQAKRHADSKKQHI